MAEEVLLSFPTSVGKTGPCLSHMSEKLDGGTASPGVRSLSAFSHMCGRHVSLLELSRAFDIGDSISDVSGLYSRCLFRRMIDLLGLDLSDEDSCWV